MYALKKRFSIVLWDFPGGSDSKESACNVGDPGLIPGPGRSPGEGNDNPLQCSCLENPTDRGSLVGYSPWGHKKSDMTTANTFTYCTLNLCFISV